MYKHSSGDARRFRRLSSVRSHQLFVDALFRCTPAVQVSSNVPMLQFGIVDDTVRVNFA